MDAKLINAKAQQIKVVATDVDGVLTEGFIFIRDDYEEPFGKFSILDGFAIGMARDCGLKTVVISGRKSLATEARCHKLGMDLAYTGVSDKKAKMLEIATELGVELNEIAYIGDDLSDWNVMQHCGLAVAVKDAHPYLQRHAHYVTSLNGGFGAVRELCDLLLISQQKFATFTGSST